MTTKRCLGCGQEKTLSDYHKNKRSSDGVRSQCKSCVNKDIKTRYDRDPERKLVKNREWKVANMGRNNLTGQKWYTKNKGRLRSVRRAWEDRNRDARRVSARNRRQHLNMINEVEPGQWESLVRVFGGKCLYPGCTDTHVTQDHIIPRSLGGRHHVSNLQPLCVSHNASKGVKSTDYRAFVVEG